MKIDTCKRVKLFLGFVLLTMILSVLSAFFMYLLWRKLYIILLSFIPLVASLYVIIRLMYFVFENSGEVISIQYYHPLWYSRHRNVEFPLSKVQYVEVKRSFFRTLLVFGLKKEGNNKIIKLYYNVSALKYDKLHHILNSIPRASYISNLDDFDH